MRKGETKGIWEKYFKKEKVKKVNFNKENKEDRK